MELPIVGWALSYQLTVKTNAYRYIRTDQSDQGKSSIETPLSTCL